MCRWSRAGGEASVGPGPDLRLHQAAIPPTSRHVNAFRTEDFQGDDPVTGDALGDASAGRYPPMARLEEVCLARIAAPGVFLIDGWRAPGVARPVDPEEVRRSPRAHVHA
jgi:hypothetical protein